MLERLKKEVFEANLQLVQEKLVILTWGNASGIDRERNLVVIKPSGVPYYKLKVRDMVVVDMEGKTIEGDLKPSVDLPIHLAIYRNIPNVGGVVHTHSHFATCWAQARKPIPCLGTTHADYFFGDIPLTELPNTEDYETSIGEQVVKCTLQHGVERCKAVLVPGHGPFVWGENVEKAVETAFVLEQLAEMAYHTVMINNGDITKLEDEYLNKHYERKWGKDAYYGQK
ncbi:MAG TPA: L-ribulose-5-phosphate 4-epimerase AraD [Candidatus Hydrogenedens sp.]|nr:L-ribulose-5-phosphate 4-epimerase AraD [Candidatus Hydrogenedens sp.]HOL19873.1 L-ribulose-5-phosphate 4-epimerase AraD [Candidatus Hydrogenedens sp.]HPP59796.1 L-ribulose-5-phosphate 4-epimerase AraD [Candidatus Hydrogenedens sp.]